MPVISRLHDFLDVEAAARLKQNTSSPLNGKQIKRTVIVMGASAGGIEVLIRIFSELPPDLGAVVAVVLHRGPIVSELRQVLAKRSVLPIIEPAQTLALRKGTILLAPPDHHLHLTPRQAVIRRGPKEHSTRPAIDPLFRSAADSFGSRVVGVLLSGCGDDGVTGLLTIKENGGICVVQDPEEADMPFMPMNAIRYDHVDRSLPAKAIASVLATLTKGVTVNDESV
ncbi:MAG TPA: chemotaxis protein CheB [Nitrospiraceae bacterium]|nr:chemotaxis protein CheB [Nitrospiraceae bacterium]